MEASSRQRAQGRPGTESTQRSFSGLTNWGVASRFSREDLRDAGNTPPRAMGSWKTTGPVGNARPAASSVMAGRKLFNRNQNPSRAGVNTTRSFSDMPMNTPGRVFASSSFKSGLANGNNKFTFSPRVPHNTIRESFPTVTPGRSFRGSSADMSGRGMSKASATNLFQMRITSPPPELSGEALTKQVPDNPNRVGSIYADEFLSHLVPPELDDLQRRQFLCILDLRRLKYASNEIFVKKDWRVNIMNFAKEYEKSRSLIMLRYGLYEFKTVPASRELLKKWKQENAVPDEDEEMADDSTLRSNGSFRASTKRPAEDDLPRDDAPRSFSSQNKRRAPDREPLAESAAPTSNAGATPFSKKTKRGLEEMDQDEENQPSKMLKSKPSATLSLFEEVANNTPAKRAASPVKPASKPLFGDATASKPQPSIFAQPTSQSGAAKPASSGGNIFGHLSQQNTPIASDDEDESEGGDESEEEVEEVPAPEKKAPSATPAFGNAGSSLFGNKPSAPFGGSTPSGNLFGKGPSLMDRASKEAEAEAAKPSEKQATSPPKQNQPQDKTWNPNTPIKFGGATASTSTPLFGAPTAQSGSLFGKPSAATPATGSTQVKDFATETPKASAPSLFGQTEKSSEASSNLFGNATKTPLFGKSEQQKPSESTAPTSLFGAKPLDANTTPFGKSAETPATGAQSAKSLFGGLSTPTPSTQPSAPSLFGANNEKPATSIFGTNDKPSNSLFGATNGDKPSTTSNLFGAKSNTEEKKEESAAKRKKPDSDAAEEKPALKFSFGGDAPTPAEKLPPKTAAAANGATDAASVFGAPNVGEKKYTFGAPAAASAAASSDAPAAAPVAAPAFSFGSTTASNEPAKTPSAPSLFGNATSNELAKTPAAPSLFGNATSQPEPAKTQPSIFANAAPSAPSTGFTFGAQPSTTSAEAPSTGLFGTSTTNNTSNANGGSIFSFGANSTPAPAPASGSFTFNSGGGDNSFNPAPVTFNPSQPPSFDFGASSGASGFQFGAGSTPAPAAPFSFGGTPAASSNSFSFGGASQPTNDAPANGMFSGGSTNGGSSMFSFGGGSQEQSQPASGLFSGQPANAAQGIFANQLAAPPTTSGANTPLFGGASSVATTPATGTPEPEAAKNDSANGKADDEDAPQDQQLSLAEGGPGEEEEEVVHEVRAKALRHVPVQPDDDEEVKAKKKATPWQTEGLGPLRVLKHKTSGAVRILLRTEPSGKVAMNKLVLPNFDYKVDKGVKWLKVTTAKDDGKGLETWMLQVKTNEFAVKLAAALEEHKVANKK